MIQRLAMRSYDTTGSPSLLAWHPPPNPDHSVLIGTGPNSGVPVFENTAKSVLTISTTWLGPTAPLLSGGAEFTVNVPAGPVKPCPMPSKLLVVVGARSAAAPALRGACTTGSLSNGSTRDDGMRLTGSASRLPKRRGPGGSSRSGGETSW